MKGATPLVGCYLMRVAAMQLPADAAGIVKFHNTGNHLKPFEDLSGRHPSVGVFAQIGRRFEIIIVPVKGTTCRLPLRRI